MWNLLHRLRPRRYTQNFLLVTYDSCRWDAYAEAKTPVLDAYGPAVMAGAQATYTYASHASMFQGMLPHVFAEVDYYNRFKRQLWRLSHRKTGEEPAVRLPKGSKSIIDGFNKLGYFTCGTAAMAWFKNNYYLRDGWQAFEWTGIAARRQVEWTLEQVRRHRGQPVFGFLNFGETHSPYKTEGLEGTEGDAVARGHHGTRGLQQRDQWQFDEDRWRAQIRCTEYLDARMGDLLNGFSDLGKDVTVVMCGDHGDCFGEDGLYGHGFYHPKVMEVPMAIFDHRADGPRHPA